MFLCSRIRENLGPLPGIHPNSHESGYSQYVPREVFLTAIKFVDQCVGLEFTR